MDEVVNVCSVLIWEVSFALSVELLCGAGGSCCAMNEEGVKMQDNQSSLLNRRLHEHIEYLNVRNYMVKMIHWWSN